MPRFPTHLLPKLTLSTTLFSWFAGGCVGGDENDSVRSRVSSETTLEADDDVETLIEGKGEERRTALPPAERRERAVSLRLKELGLSGDARTVDVARVKRLDIELFDERRLRVDLSEMVARSARELVWSGRVLGKEHGQVHLAIVDGTAAGSVRIGKQRYAIEASGSGYRLVELDTEALPAPACDRAPRPGLPAPATEGIELAGAPAPSPGLRTMDLLAVYTRAAREQAGGEAAIRAQIMTAIAIANTTYVNSRIDIAVRLVGASEIAYAETNNVEADIAALYAPDDGKLDEVGAQRDALGADFVTLITSSDPSSCGIGGILPGRPEYAPYAMNVVVRKCLSDDTLAHELGHNMGASHDVASASGPGVFPYSYGHRVPDKFRTVMAYRCPGNTCPSVPYFSNPDLSYKGLPLGVPGKADNARALNVTAPVSEAFRAPSRAVNAPPRAAFSVAPESGVAPLLATFDASKSTDDDGKIVSYRWLFGDGASDPASGAGSSTVTHEFSADGSYVVALTVTDDHGATSTTTRTVVVGGAMMDGGGGGFGSGGTDAAPSSPPSTTPPGGVTCRAGRTACNGMCVKLSSNEAHCGACGRTCPTGADCRNGKCECDGKVCGGRCVDLDDDDENCGACGNACSAGMSCWDGRCE